MNVIIYDANDSSLMNVQSLPDRAYYSYTCTNQIFGNEDFQKAEKEFKNTSKEDVYFGIGAYANHPQPELGMCYRATVKDLDKDLIFQNVDTGDDVYIKQVDLVMAGGGFGIYNACANGKSCKACVYDAEASQFGDQYSGITDPSQCNQLPEFPTLDTVKNPNNNLQKLCEYNFTTKVKNIDGKNPTIEKIGQVKCPEELTDITGLKPKDIAQPDSYIPKTYDFETEEECQDDNLNLYCLTSNQDCSTPSAFYFGNVKEENFKQGYLTLRGCSQDTTTIVNSQCGCLDCNTCSTK